MTNPQTFDAAAFLETFTEEANDTKVIPVPAGEYIAQIKSVEPRSWSKTKDTGEVISGMTLDITWSLDDQPVRELLGRAEVTCKQGIMLDMTPQGTLDMGKGRNVGLGRLREAVGLNIPGQPFSLRQLAGQAAKVKIAHELVQNKTTGESDIYARVTGAAKIA